jgi:branched-chain amino acid transport system permease protein
MSFSAWLELLASGLITGGIYALVALGLNLQYGLMRILNIAHGEFLMVGAYLTWMAQTSLGLNPLFMVPVSFAMLFVLGWVIHRLCFRRLTVTSPNLDIFEARGLWWPSASCSWCRTSPRGCGAATCAATTTWPSR